MMGERPEGGEFRGLWGVGVVAPKVCIPQRAGAGYQGVFKHIDGRAELLPKGSSP
jgi:hypothetical protein